MAKIEQIAKKHYAKLPYHNFQHALNVKKYALKLVRRCKKYKVPVDSELVEIAALFHDAGYEKVKNNKEEYSCKIAEQELKKLKYPPNKIIKVKQAIMATKAGYSLRTTEQKILRAADLHSFTASYKQFSAASKKIESEYYLLYKKTKFPIKQWVKSMELYLLPDIILTPEYKKDDFHAKARRNINKFLYFHP